MTILKLGYVWLGSMLSPFSYQVWRKLVVKWCHNPRWWQYQTIFQNVLRLHFLCRMTDINESTKFPNPTFLTPIILNLFKSCRKNEF